MEGKIPRSEEHLQGRRGGGEGESEDADAAEIRLAARE